MRMLVPALVLAALAGPAAAADDEAMRSDVRCVLALSALIQNPQYREAAGAGTLYFVGRIDGRDRAYDLAAAMRRELGRISIADEARRCSAELKARNDALKAMGEAIRSRGVGR